MPSSAIRSRYPVCYRKYSTQIVGRMAPFSCQPAIVVVQPSNHRSYVEGAIDRVKDIWCTGDSRTIWDDGPLDNGSEKLGAFFKSKSFQAAADGIEEDVACGFILSDAKHQCLIQRGLLGKTFTHGKIWVNFVAVYVAGHVLDLWIELPDANHCRGIGPQSGHYWKGLSCRNRRV